MTDRPNRPAAARLKRPLWGFALLLCAFLPAAAAASPLPLGPGESLRYRVAWAILPGAGEITVSASATTDVKGAPELRIVSTTSTRGLAWLLLPFHARAESLYDAQSHRLLWLGESSQTRAKGAAHTVSFDYARHSATYTNSADPNEVEQLPFPPNSFPSDLITCLLEARNWKLSPGATHDAVVVFNDEVFLLTVHARGYENVVTPLGTFSCLELEPRMEKTPPKGMFKRGSTVEVWISQDNRRLPLQFRVDFKFGSGTATLAEYHPPLGN